MTDTALRDRGSKPMSLAERLDYAIDLIEQINANEKSEQQRIYQALAVLDFGNITVQQMLFYMDKRR